MNWYIGQPIVAIKNCQCYNYRKGDEFTILALRKGICGCNPVEVHIGIDVAEDEELICDDCGHAERASVWFFDIRDFAPLDQDISELTEILKSKQPFEL